MPALAKCPELTPGAHLAPSCKFWGPVPGQDRTADAAYSRRSFTHGLGFTLGLLARLGGLETVVGHVRLQNHAVVYQTVYGCGRRHRVLEDALPLAEGQIARKQLAAPLVALRQQQEQHPHLLEAVLHVTVVVDNERLKAREPLQELGQAQLLFGL